MAEDWIERLNAFYSAYMAYFGVEADEVVPNELDAKDRATIAGLRAAIAMETGTAIDSEAGVVAKP